MNKIILIGNLTRDPDPIRTTPGGHDVCSFTIAVDRKRKGQDGEKVTDFFRINAWNGMAQTCQKYLSKGKKVGVTGELQARMYESNGKTGMSLDVQADEVEFLSPKGQVEPEVQKSMDEMQDIPADDIPF